MEFNLHKISILSKSLSERKRAFGREKETLRNEKIVRRGRVVADDYQWLAVALRFRRTLRQ
ncbi:uncharacterized protein G2W53_039828 [Senna tora]|uniref:Uncharacterized protein n=1 Tax=Senna tora TaxID=362788 RepID=A0A834W338_9FABA|nr:uncharacterized protein G2W53_039828 [Senna tora]